MKNKDRFNKLVKQITTKINKGKLKMEMSKIINHPFLKEIKEQGGMKKMNEWCETNGHKNLSNLLQDPTAAHTTDTAVMLLDVMLEDLQEGILWDCKLSDLLTKAKDLVDQQKPDIDEGEEMVPVREEPLKISTGLDEPEPTETTSTIEGKIRQSTDNPLPNPVPPALRTDPAEVEDLARDAMKDVANDIEQDFKSGIQAVVQKEVLAMVPGLVNTIMRECDNRYFRQGSVEIHMVDLNKEEYKYE